jgi:hypothetical protein
MVHWQRVNIATKTLSTHSGHIGKPEGVRSRSSMQWKTIIYCKFAYRSRVKGETAMLRRVPDWPALPRLVGIFRPGSGLSNPAASVTVLMSHCTLFDTTTATEG